MTDPDDFRLQAAVAICKDDGTWDECKALIQKYYGGGGTLAYWGQAKSLLDSKFGEWISFTLRLKIQDEINGR